MAYSDVSTCHRCPLIRHGGRGLATCADTGRDVREQARDGACPRNYFEVGVPSAAAIAGVAAPAEVDPWGVRGPQLWADLHEGALRADLSTEGLRWLHGRVILQGWRDLIGCGECKAHWLAWEAANPADVSSNAAFFAWTVAGHNAVNRRLGKREWTVAEAMDQWGRSTAGRPGVEDISKGV